MSAGVVVRVRAALALRASRSRLRNGRTLSLHGRLRGRPRRKGLLVELQARRGARWQTFGVTSTKARGRFRFDYTFTRTRGRQRYALRARVPRQQQYPYATGASRPVTVTVLG